MCKSGEESLNLLLEKNIFFKKCQKWCLGGIMIAHTPQLGSDELKMSKKIKRNFFEFCYLAKAECRRAFESYKPLQIAH